MDIQKWDDDLDPKNEIEGENSTIVITNIGTIVKKPKKRKLPLRARSPTVKKAKIYTNSKSKKRNPVAD